MKKLITLSLIVVLFMNLSYAHEPIYGLGPETLPKHMHAVELGSRFATGNIAYEIGYGFGITQNWTVRVDVPTISINNDFGVGDVRFRTKYALWRKTAPGVLKRLTAIAVIKFPTANKNFNNLNTTAFTLGIANGYESRRWYYFSDIGYTYFQSSDDLTLGEKLKYNLVGGIRPVKSGYLKPDLVLLVELNGVFSRKNQLNGNDLQRSGGNTLAVAPGFLLSYRNIMLKGGMQFGVASTKYETDPVTNGLVSFEYHF
jgi:Putative MetA-pathway of phenol degradation